MAKQYRRYGTRRSRRSKNASQEIVILLVIAVLVLVGAGSSNGGFSSGLLAAFITIALLIGFGVLAVIFYISYRRQQALRLLDLAAVDSMQGLQFEKWVGAQLQVRGYKVQYTPINDYGVDILAKKDGVKTAVQVKRYRKYLDQKPVREAVAGMMHYRCGSSMVVTNSHFSRAAKVLAKSNNCTLVDREKLAGWLAEQRQN